MSKKTILIFIIISAIFLIISIANITLSFKTFTLPLKAETDSGILAKTENDLKLTGIELEKHKYLLDNLNSISLKTIYFGKAENEGIGSGHFFTAFSLFYKEKFYLITAGHSIELDGEKYKNFQFKPNNRDMWISPKLLYYKNDIDNNKDFAILEDPFNRNGLYPADKNLTPEYIFGNTSRGVNIVKIYNKGVSAIFGESGSPVLNSECQVVGVLIKNKGEYTEIENVLAALEEIVKD
ncbi:MAG: hypothetical protein ACYCXK_02880 [Candidatus Humimicrobiaceae bacterium]